jgi:hypothetical protein
MLGQCEKSPYGFIAGREDHDQGGYNPGSPPSLFRPSHAPPCFALHLPALPRLGLPCPAFPRPAPPCNALLGKGRVPEPCLFLKLNKIFDWKPTPIQCENHRCTELEVGNPCDAMSILRETPTMICPET